MSWNEDYRQNNNCPCGRGNYAIIRKSDDWGRSEDIWAMNCDMCKIKYQLFEFTTIDSHMKFPDFRWVPIDDYNEFKLLQKELDNKKTMILIKAKNKYLSDWIDSFILFKTKKKIWEILKTNNRFPVSLSTFYRNTKSKGRQEFLESHFSFENLEYILSYLGASNDNIIIELEKFHSSLDDLEEYKDELVENGFR